MFFRKKSRPARFATWAFADLLVLFAIISLYRPTVGLTGLGAVLVLVSILVEANHKNIWQSYQDNYKKSKSKSALMRPQLVFYQLNIYLVWPIVFMLGLISIYFAYRLG